MFTQAGFEAAFSYWQLFLQGVVCTVLLSALAVFFGFIIALILALMRMGRIPPLRWLATAYVELFRATPMVVQVWIVYFVASELLNLPRYMIFGVIRFERFLPGVIALSLNSGAYLCEIIRSGIGSIPIGQTEAARSLGLPGGKTMRLIVLPQAMKNILPALANEFVTIIKESSITYVIGVQEIMSAANSVKGATYRALEGLVVAAGLYFCLCFPTSKIIAHFERKMSRGYKR
ncbi:MAG TPA: amino acid ABC transporter permease [Candidatus Scatomorpha pullistercoris]|uniref:Amino acid ABC transporter permease n=1 Tax=Candidatus Scatomorpha pullistercoris TaxID=2840929 RepID=A0A9D1G478_9FIRM|nr:amino acid ABC transporter permease [Candidatus Scatomorpha pullistercoris]